MVVVWFFCTNAILKSYAQKTKRYRQALPKLAPTKLPSMLHYQTVPVTPFEQNCSIVWCDQTHQAAIIDPGGDLDLLIATAQKLGVTLEQI